MENIFWSAYYSNDVMTGIDRLIDFFIPINDRRYKNTDIRKDKFTLLKEIIDYPSKKNESIFDDGQISKDDRVPDEKRIIVFDGIEKLLIPNAENTEGISVSPEVKEFFKIISHQNNKNTRIILTSRIFPTDILYHFDSRINREERGEQIKKLEDAKLAVRETNVISAPKCWVKDLIITAEDSNSSAVEVKQAETMKDLIINPKNPKNFQESFTQLFIDIDEHYISSICSLVDGHIFGISLIKGVLEDVRGAEKVNKVNELIEKFLILR